MKLTYIYNACVTIEHLGVKVLCDPWLSDGIYYGSWFQYPKPKAKAEDFFDVDYIYVSHIHPDHLDIKTLEKFPKNIPIIICNYSQKFLYQIIERLGFTHIIELSQTQKMSLGKDFKIEVIAADFCDPKMCQKHFSCSLRPNATLSSQQIDSLAVFSTSESTLVNLNDVPYSLSKQAIRYINSQYDSIDCALVGYSGAGPYPQCFDNLNLAEKKLQASLKKKQFLNQSMAFLSQLKPKHFMPFAGQYVLGGTLSHLNNDRGVSQIEELPSEFEHYLKKHQLSSKFFMLNSGEYFDLKSSLFSKPFTPPNPSEREAYIKEVLAKKKLDYENEPNKEEELKPLIEKAYAHLMRYQNDWSYRPEQNLYIDFGNEEVLCLPSDQSGFFYTQKLEKPYVKIKLDRRLFSRILQKKAHWNNAEIGSHLRFDRAPNIYDRSLYLTLSYFHI